MKCFEVADELGIAFLMNENVSKFSINWQFQYQKEKTLRTNKIGAH